MTEMFSSGRIADLIIVLMAVELVVLGVWRRLRGGGIAPGDLLPNVLAGVALVLALRAALTSSGAVWIGLWLSAALVAHVADLRTRWRR
jgi:hypothetical protein